MEGNRCNCYNGHNSSSGRCHHYKPFDKEYCPECIADCGKVEPVIVVDEVAPVDKEVKATDPEVEQRVMELRCPEYAATAEEQFKKYIQFLELTYEEWKCKVEIVDSEHYVMTWSAKICVDIDKDKFKIPVAGRYGFSKEVKFTDFRQMFALTCGVGMHPRSEMFTWILQQERRFRLNDSAHDSITEVLLRSTIASLLISGVQRNDIHNAYMEQSHFEFNVARVMSSLQGGHAKRHHGKKAR